MEERVAAVEAMGAIHGPVIHFLDHLIAATSGKPSSSPVADAAVRTVPADLRRSDPVDRAGHGTRLSAGTEARGPEGACRASGGGQRIIELARGSKLPDDLKTEAVTLL